MESPNLSDIYPINERVPTMHPFGGLTDGQYICSRCREAITGCALCADMGVSLMLNRSY